MNKSLINIKKTNSPASSGAGSAGGAASAQKASEKIVPRKSLKERSELLYKFNEYLKEKFCTEGEVVGIEIQPDILRVAEAKKEQTGWKVTKLVSAKVLDNSQIENLKKNKSIYSKALKDLFLQNKISNKTVALAIPASTAIIKTVSLPLMTRENLERATRIPSFWQSLVQISDNIAEYFIYYRIVEENPATKEMDVLFLAAKHEDLKTYIDIVKDAGLELCIIDVGCFSINNISKLKKENAKTMEAFLKVGRDENYLQVLENDKPYIYDIFVSDNEKAYLAEYIENPMFQQRFISQLKHIITKHEDKYQVKIDKVSIISGEVNIEKFIEAINPKLETFQTAQINLMDNIKVADEVLNNEDFQKTKSSFSIVTGLATRNLDIFADEKKMNVSESVNLLPEGKEIINSLKAKFYSKILFWGTSLFCVIFVVFYLIFSIGKYHTVSAESKLFNEQNKIYKGKQQIFTSISNESSTLNKLIKIKDSIDSNQGILIKALGEISATIPEGVWVEEIKFDKDHKVTITGKAFEESSIIKFSRSFEEGTALKEMSINNIKSVNLDNNINAKEFLITGKLKEAE